MPRRLLYDDRGAGYWVSAHCKVPFNPYVDTCISVHRGEEIIGGVLFTQFTGRGGSCTIHVASDKTGYWATKAFVRAVFDHAFLWLGVEKLFGQVPASAPPNVLAFNLNLGFREEMIVRDVYPDGDMILLAMYKRDCKFLDIRPGGHLFG